jgi:hypothetical protein
MPERTAIRSGVDRAADTGQQGYQGESKNNGNIAAGIAVETAEELRGLGEHALCLLLLLPVP